MIQFETYGNKCSVISVKPFWKSSKDDEDMERDVFMSAAEAQAHGIVDLVAVE